MKNWQKRFIIWFNLAILFVFLDVSLLIFVRSINHEGIYQTTAMKWETFFVWALCYAIVCLGQILGYVLFKRHKSARSGS